MRPMLHHPTNGRSACLADLEYRDFVALFHGPDHELRDWARDIVDYLLTEGWSTPDIRTVHDAACAAEGDRHPAGRASIRQWDHFVGFRCLTSLPPVS